MLVYSLTGILVYLSLRNYEQEKKNQLMYNKGHIKNFYKFFAVIALTLVYGLRSYTVGSDTITYYQIFNWLGTELIWKNLYYEKGFSILNILVNKYCDNFTILLLIVGFIIYWNIVNSFCELSRSPSISIMCYFGIGSFAQSCNLLRQYIAISFCLLALYYFLKRNKFIEFIFFICLGVLFHKSAIVFLLILPLKYIRFNIYSVVFFIAGTIILVPFLPIIIKIFDLAFGTGYQTYFSLGARVSILNLVILLMSVILLVLIFRFRPIIKRKDNIKEYDLYAKMLVVFICLMLLSVFASELIDRISIYFLPSLYFIIPIILNTFKEYKSKIFCFLMINLFVLFLSFMLVVRGAYGILPYNFVF